MQVYEECDRKEKKEDAKRLPFKSNLILRMIAAAYLLYLVYGIKDSIFYGTGTKQVMFAVFGLLFLTAAVFLLASSLRRLALGQYAEAVQETEAFEQQQACAQEKPRAQNQMCYMNNVKYAQDAENADNAAGNAEEADNTAGSTKDAVNTADNTNDAVNTADNIQYADNDADNTVNAEKITKSAENT